MAISAYQFKGHVVEIHNRRANHPLSTGNKLAFKQLTVVGSFYQHTLQHSYDTVSRLKQTAYRTGDAVTGTPFHEYNFTYDLAGNRTNQTVKLNGVVNANVNYSYNDFNQLLSDGVNTYAYDANGNLSTINGAVAYTWDRANRLLSHGGSAYTYNGVGHRLSQTIGINVTQYLQDVQPSLSKLLSATTGANTTRYVHDGMGIHSQENPDGTWNYMLLDGLGSVRGLIDASPNVLGTRQYDPYGNVWNTTGSANTPFDYIGQLKDINNLLHFRARYYNPSLANFNSLDIVEASNRYFYAFANPITYTDPSGEFPCFGICEKVEQGVDAVGNFIDDPVGGVVSASANAIDTIGLEDEFVGFAKGWGKRVEQSRGAFADSLLGINWTTQEVQEHPKETAVILGILIGIEFALLGQPVAGLGATTNVVGQALFTDRYDVSANQAVKSALIDSVAGGAAGYLISLVPGLNFGSSVLANAVGRAGAFGLINSLQGAGTKVGNQILLDKNYSFNDYVRGAEDDFLMGFVLSLVFDTPAMISGILKSRSPISNNITPALTELMRRRELGHRFVTDPFRNIPGKIASDIERRLLYQVYGVIVSTNIFVPSLSYIDENYVPIKNLFNLDNLQICLG